MTVEDDGGAAATGAAAASPEVAPTAFTDVMSATFQQAITDGAPPEVAFAQAEAACTEVAVQMGVPAADVAANLETAQATFNDAVAAGSDPAAAMCSAAGQAATNMGMEPGVGGGDATDMIATAMGSAYEAAIQAGSPPAEAFAIGKAAAEGMATEMGIDPLAPGPFLDTMTSVQATFTDAVSSGADPAAAMAGAQGIMDAGPALMGDPALVAANPAFQGPLESGFAGGMPEGFAPPVMSMGPDGTLVQPPVMGDAMMMGPGGVPMVNPAMMQPGAMQMGPNGEYQAADPNFFPPPPFGDPAFMPPQEGMPGYEAFSAAAQQCGLDPMECCVPGFVPPAGTPGMDQPGMPSAPVFDPAGGAFAPPPPYMPMEGSVVPVAPDSFQPPDPAFFDPGMMPPDPGGTAFSVGSFAGPGAPMVQGPDGMLMQDPNFAPPDPFGINPPPAGPTSDGPVVPPDPFGTNPPPAGPTSDGPLVPPDPTGGGTAPDPAAALDQAFVPPAGPDPVPIDPVADAVGGAADAAVPQGPAPAPDPVATPAAPDPGPAPEPADVPPPPEDPVAG